jgi:K+ transporter
MLWTGLILGDGVLTPAMTIVSAMEGLQLAVSGVTRGAPPILGI